MTETQFLGLAMAIVASFMWTASRLPFACWAFASASGRGSHCAGAAPFRPPKATNRRYTSARRDTALTVQLRRFAVVFLGALLCPAAFGQSIDTGDHAKQLRFEVVSVKPSRAVEHGGGSSGLQPGGRFVLTNGPVRVLINMAYPTLTREIVGAPDCVTYDNYDVEARVGHDLRYADLAPLIRNLLADRFKLQAHIEERVRPVYELRVAAADRRLGPAMRPSSVDCEASRNACSTKGGRGSIDSNGMPMAAFVTWLPALVGRPVLDKTDLPGYYELLLKYSADATTDAPSIFTALREQLGLTLKPVDAPTDEIVIRSRRTSRS